MERGWVSHEWTSSGQIPVREAIAATNLNTIVGPIKYNDKNYSRTPLVGGQWVKGKKWPWEIIITYDKEYPQIPKAGKTKPIAK